MSEKFNVYDYFKPILKFDIDERLKDVCEELKEISKKNELVELKLPLMIPEDTNKNKSQIGFDAAELQRILNNTRIDKVNDQLIAYASNHKPNEYNHSLKTLGQSFPEVIGYDYSLEPDFSGTTLIGFSVVKSRPINNQNELNKIQRERKIHNE